MATGGGSSGTAGTQPSPKQMGRNMAPSGSISTRSAEHWLLSSPGRRTARGPAWAPQPLEDNGDALSPRTLRVLSVPGERGRLWEVRRMMNEFTGRTVNAFYHFHRFLACWWTRGVLLKRETRQATTTRRCVNLTRVVLTFRVLWCVQ